MPLEVPSTGATPANDAVFDADKAVDSYLTTPTEPVHPPGAMRESMAAAVDTNPDQEAEARKIAARTGVPITSVFSNRDQIVKQHNFDSFDFDGYAKQNPTSANLLSDTEFAKVAHDDAENMGLIEGSLNVLGKVGSSAKAAPYSFMQGVFGTVEVGAAFGQKYLSLPEAYDPTGRNAAFGAVKDIYGYVRRGAASSEQRIMQPVLDNSGPLEGAAYSGVQSLIANLPGVVASVITKNPAFSLASGGITQGGTSAGNALDKGRDPLVALGYGLADATVEVGTEMIPITKFIGDIHAGSGFLKTIGHQIVTEVPGELMATTLQNFNEWAVLNPDKPFKTYLDQLPSDLAQTLVSTITAVGAQTGAITLGHKAVTRLQAREQTAQAGEQGAQTVEALNKLAASSKLLQRDPDSFERFIEAANKDSDVQDIYLDPRDLAQSGIDIAKLAEISPSVAKQAQTATDTGGLLKIPVSEYATNVAASELSQSLLDHAKTDPLGMSRNEAKEFMQSAKDEFEADITKSMQDGKVNREFLQSREVVHNNIFDQLENANRFTEDVNQQYASLLSNFYSVQATRLGVTPEEMFKQYPVGIQAQGVGALSQPVNSNVNPDQNVNVVDLNSIGGKDITSQKLKEVLRELAGVKLQTANLEHLINVLPKNVNHVVYSSMPQQTASQQVARRKSVASISDLISNAVLIESAPNTKKDTKPDVETYHRFYVPVQVGKKVHTVRIVAEQTSKGIRLAPNEFDLYDVIPEKKIPSVVANPQSGAQSGKPLETGGDNLTIRQMLTGVKDTDGNAYFQAVYHGTPYHFDKFTLDHIGSGEGAQAYGWGLYFAGRKEVAEYYRRQLSPATFKNGQKFDPRLEFQTVQASRAYQENSSVSGAIAALKEESAEIRSGNSKIDKSVADLIDRDIKTLEGVNRENGQLYEVQIPENDVMLDWDKPLSKQPKAVRDALAVWGFETDEKAMSDYDDALLSALTEDGDTNLPKQPKDPTGEEIYSQMNLYVGRNRSNLEMKFGDDAWGRADKISSKLLNESGIKGIKYLDGTSRKEGEGSSNFVVFDDAAIKTLQTFYQGDATHRGSFNPETSTITLLQAADLSTFLHEAGHFFLETMNSMASTPGAPSTITDDFNTALKWMGVASIEEWNSRTLEEQRPAHEQFARGFEAYLFEGKAPNAELAGIFGRFRDWLLMVYKSIGNLNVELSDDIRQVFDRLLATNETIAEAESLTGFSAMFASAEDAGMSADEWTQYQKLGAEATEQARAELGSKTVKDIKWLSNARSKKLKELQKEAEAKRRAIKREVTDEVMNEPVNLARSFIRTGVTTDGVKTEGAHRLDIEDVKEILEAKEGGATALASMENKYGKYGMLGKDGLHPDAVAEQFGFSSGDELIQKLLGAEDPREKISALTDQRMLERYGDITDPKSLERAADAAIHNDARARFVATEVNALNRATGKRKILTEAAKQYAEMMISRLRVRDLKPSRYTAAEAKAARAAEKAMRSGDLETAAIEKRSQLVQMHAAKAALETQDEIDKALRYFNKFAKDGVRKNISNDYVDQIDALLERFDLRKGISLKQLDKRASLLDWVETQKEVGLEPDIPTEMLDAANRKHYKDMTVEEMRGLIDTVKQIEHLGRLKEKLLTAADNRGFEKTVNDIADSIYEHRTGVANNITRATAGDRAIRLFKGYIAQHRKIASLSRQMDGVKDGGAMWETFIRSMNVAGDNEASMREVATEKLAQMVGPIMKLGKMGGKGIYFETIGRSLNREERITMALNMGNEGNIQRLLGGENWTIEQIQPVLDTITPQEAKFVQDVWDLFESYRPQIGAKEKRIYGKEPEWVQPTPVTLGGVELKGGYFPIKYDARRSLAAEQHSDAELAKAQMKGAYTSATTRRSFTKSRVEEVRGRPLLLTMDGLYNGLNEVIHDLSWHEWLIDANRLMRNKHLNGTIRDIYGAEVVQQFKTAIQDIAGGEMPSGGAFEKVMSNLRSGASVAGLGLNLVSAAVNVTGISQSFVRVGPKWVLQGIDAWAHDPAGFVSKIYEKSDFMRLRGKTMNREINEIQSMLRDKSKTRAALDRWSYLPMTMTQIAVDAPTWWGAYQKALAEGGNDEARAVALADQAVIDAQGGGQTKDLAAIQRGGPIQKLFTTFYSYFSTTLQLTAEQTAKTNFKDPKDVMRLGGDYLMLYVVPAMLGTIIKGILMGDVDDWWNDPSLLAKQLANDEVSYAMGPLVGVRETSAAVQKAFGVNSFSSGYGGPAGVRFLQEFDKLGQQIGQGDLDMALVHSVVNVGGIALRLPSSQINRTIDGAAAIMEGNSINPFSLVTGGPRD